MGRTIGVAMVGMTARLLRLQLLSSAALSAQALRIGGEWAGWCCAFSATSGIVVPVDEKYCTGTMIAYDEIPGGFEELTTEDDGVRRITRVLPESGCSIEDMPAEVTRTDISSLVVGDLAASAFDTVDDGDLWRIESIFDGFGGVRPRDKRNSLPSAAERTRVSLLFDAKSGALAAEEPIFVWQERQWSTVAELKVNEGGGRSGIDGAWISSAIGIDNFGESKEAKAPPAPPAPTDGGFGLSLAGGVEIRCARGVLEVAVGSADGRVCLQRTAFDAASGSCQIDVSQHT